MSSDRDTTRIVRSWLVDGATALPDRVLDAVLDQLPATHQRRAIWWPARRIPLMNTAAKFGLAAAVVVVAALLGYSYFVAPNVGGPGLDDLSPAPTPTPAPASFTEFPGGGTELEPGTYLIDYGTPVLVTITVPAEPYETYPSPWYKAMYDWGPWHQSNAARIGFGDVENVFVDPCSPELGMVDPAVGPTVADLADAIANVPGVEVSQSEATLDGYAGLLLELTRNDISAECPDEPLMLETTEGDVILTPRPGDRVRIWILDVEGTRLTVWVGEDAAFSSPEHMQALIDTIQIDAP
jgi:hypothetical protein